MTICKKKQVPSLFLHANVPISREKTPLFLLQSSPQHPPPLGPVVLCGACGAGLGMLLQPTRCQVATEHNPPITKNIQKLLEMTKPS